MINMLKKEEGFSIVEAVAAQVVLVIGALCICNVYIVGSRFNAEAEDRTVAANVAQMRLEEIMNTRFRYIIAEHPPGETYFRDKPKAEPFWTISLDGQWIPSLPEGRYVISYPNGLDADPLKVEIKVLWKGHLKKESSLVVETLVSMTPGRFRGNF